MPNPTPKIHLLPDSLISKIAAGEVIERPASALKELIENSLDAGAKRIIIELEDAGRKLIRVKDDGEGMSAEDAERAIQRHATSKLSAEETLFAISSLGFRGEALAAMAAVSRMTLLTKTADAQQGSALEIEKGIILSRKACAAETGTAFEVKQLFYNTPARLKFLKSDAVELKHCLDAVMRCALTRPEVFFQVKHNGSILLQAPALGDMRSTVAALFGATLAKTLLPLEHSCASCTVKGFIAPPHQARNDKSQQFLSVNKRWIRNAELSRSVYDGYHSLLFTQKHPVFFLHLSVDPASVDVNIHPTKAEVKFAHQEAIMQAVRNAAYETLQQNTLIPQVKGSIEIKERDSALSYPSASPSSFHSSFPSALSQPTSKYIFDASTQNALQVHETVQTWPGTASEERKAILEKRGTGPGEHWPSRLTAPPEIKAAAAHARRLPLLRLLGQIHKTFFVAETIGGLIYIDQHAAHERVLYEKFMKQYVNKEVKVQRLLRPELVEFTASEKALLLQYRAQLQEIGFELEEFGGNAWKILSIPSLLGRLQPRESIHDVLLLFQEGREKVLETKETIATRMACRAAVMAGDVLTIEEMVNILRELEMTELPFTCPHGRPTLMNVPVEELEKRFKRR